MTRGHTDFIDLELVYADEYDDGSNSQSPMEEDVKLWVMSLRNIIDDHGIESNMWMNYDWSADQSIEDGGSWSSDEGSDDERDESEGEGTLECPMIWAMGFMWFGNWDGIIDGSLDFLCVNC